MVVLDAMLSDDVIASEVQSFAEKITAAGEILRRDDWGKRKLAYEINYENEAYYVLYTFESKPDFPAEFERVANITDGVLRSMVTVK